MNNIHIFNDIVLNLWENLNLVLIKLFLLKNKRVHKQAQIMFRTFKVPTSEDAEVLNIYNKLGESQNEQQYTL